MSYFIPANFSPNSKKLIGLVDPASPDPVAFDDGIVAFSIIALM